MAHDATEQFWSLVKEIRTCMLSNVRDGRIESRPMAAYAHPEENRFYFITRLDTEKTKAIGDDEAVNLAFAEPKDNAWVSVEGTARVVRDPAKQEQLWGWFAEAYVPEGPRDPNVGMIEVTPEHATFWKGASWTITELWKTAVANVLQEEPSTRREEVALS